MPVRLLSPPARHGCFLQNHLQTCVRAKYSLGFTLLEKVSVNGADSHPVYQWLRLCGSPNADSIKWNFNMFLVGRDGRSCTRYANSRTPSSIREDIMALLDASADVPSPILEGNFADETPGSSARAPTSPTVP